MGTTTTNYSLNKPTVGGDEDAWGGLNNASMDLIDTQMKVNADAAATAQTAADASVQDSDIGVTVQAFDADTAKTDLAQTYTALQTFDGGIDGPINVSASAADDSVVVDNNGNVLIGTAAHYSASYRMSILCASGTGGIVIRNSAATGVPVYFQSSVGTTVGTIETTDTGTSYNTSSDYRLKKDGRLMVGNTARVKALKPVNFAWKANDTRVDGFLAHELQEVVPGAVTGIKDAMRTEEYEISPALGEVFTPAIEDGFIEVSPAVKAEPAYYDIDGNIIKPAVEGVRAVHEAIEAVAEVIHLEAVEQPSELLEGQQWRETTPQVMGEREVPNYQGIDQSKLVPLLTATIQELITRIEQLEAK